MRKLLFYKEISSNRWFIDLPKWKGDYAELEMVDGADDLLDFLSNGENDVTLNVSENYFESSNRLKFIGITNNNAGANYIISEYNGINLNLRIWLCNVTKFVFGYFPKNLYFTVH
jgi:hypothetical protein